MRRLTLAVTLALIWGVASAGLAQETTAKAKADGPAPAQLRAKIHRTTAALIEAQSAKKPDQTKIEKLTQQLQDLRQQMWAQGPAILGGQFGNWQYPWGGPGMGPGRGAAMGPGPRAGMGPRAARGIGPGGPRGMRPGAAGGMGPGRGRGRGQGLAPGWGRGGGPGRGYGVGLGRGPGYGYGYGRGLGRQWGFIDRDGDGVCDNLQRVR